MRHAEKLVALGFRVEEKDLFYHIYRGKKLVHSAFYGELNSFIKGYELGLKAGRKEKYALR